MEPINNFENNPGLINFYIGNNFYYNFCTNNFERSELNKLITYFNFLNISKNIISNKNKLNKIIYI